MSLTLQLIDGAHGKVALLLSTAQLKRRTKDSDKSLIWFGPLVSNKPESKTENVERFLAAVPDACDVAYHGPGHDNNVTAYEVSRTDGTTDRAYGTWVLDTRADNFAHLRQSLDNLFVNYMGIGGEQHGNRFRQPFPTAKFLT